MIFVKRDPKLIPEKLLAAADKAQMELEELPVEQRADFIRKKSNVWRDFSRCLRKMSHGKCWYSESPEAQSFFDVDHYRPKLESMRSAEVIDEGYQWLAFSWENFRLSANRSNRLSKNEVSNETEGKGSWFPLLDGSPKARWDDRCEEREQPVLIDPVQREDVRLIDVGANGLMGPSRTCVGKSQVRVKRSIELYGLNLPRLTDARRLVIRKINQLHESLLQTLEALEAIEDNGITTAVADALPVNTQVEMLRATTHPSSPYSRAARCQLWRLGAGEFVVQPEEAEISHVP